MEFLLGEGPITVSRRIVGLGAFKTKSRQVKEKWKKQQEKEKKEKEARETKEKDEVQRKKEEETRIEQAREERRKKAEEAEKRGKLLTFGDIFALDILPSERPPTPEADVEEDSHDHFSKR